MKGHSLLRRLLLSMLVPAAAFSQCQTIATVRPRIFFPSSGYGSYATLRDRWQSARQANTPQFQAIASQAAAYLNTEPNSFYYDSVAFEQAFLYALDASSFAAYGPRALHFLLESQQSLAPGTVITAATNTNPVVFTAPGHGLTNGGTYTVWGGTGSWAGANQSQIAVTVIDANRFSIPVNATAFGPITGTITVQANQLIGLNQARWNAPNWAAAWDWAHDQIAATLTANQIALIRNAMASGATYVVNNWHADQLGGIGNLVVGPMSGAAQMAIALSGDVPGINGVCDAARARFLAVVPQVYTTGGTFQGVPIFPLGHGGGMVESTEYSPEVIFYLLTYLQAMRSATGENLFPLLGSWYADQMKALAGMVSPSNASSGGNWPELYPFGDIIYPNQHVRTLNGVVRQCVELLAYYFASSGDSANAAYAQWWLTHTFTAAQLSGQGNTTVSPALNTPSEFLWYDPNMAASDYTSAYPTDWYADGLGMVVSRSAWAPDATWVGMKGGAMRSSDEDHFHADLLTFSLYRKGDWLTNELVGWGNNFAFTKFHNTVLPNNGQPDTRGGSNAPTFPASNGLMQTGQITRYESAGDQSYMFAEADATPTYRGSANPYYVPPYTPGINTVLRDFLFLKPDIVVIADRLAYDAGRPMTSKWLLQALSNPGSPSGKQFTLRSLLGTQALNVSVAWPPSPIYTVVQPATQITEAGTTSSNSASQWRIEMTSGNSAQSEEYLVILQSGDQGFTPAVVTALSGSNLHAAQFSGYVVAAPTDKAVSGVIRSYTFSSAAAAKHIVMGLSPHSAYAVDRSAAGVVTITDGNGGTNDIMTTDGGLLLFTSLPAVLQSAPPSVWMSCANAALDCTRVIGITSAVPGSQVQVTSSSSWLAVGGGPGRTPFNVQLTALVHDLSPGVYTGSLTVHCNPDCGGADVTVPVSLAVSPAGSLVRSIGSAARTVLLYDAPGGDPCRIRFSTNASYANPLADLVDGGGMRARSLVLGDGFAMLPSTGYYTRADCGGTQLFGNFQTPAASPSTQTVVTISGAPPSALGAVTLQIEYGSAPGALNTSSTVACPHGCSTTVGGALGSVVYVRRKWLDGSSRVIASSAVTPVLIQ